jgi:cell division septum initiation protein DivIVA
MATNKQRDDGIDQLLDRLSRASEQMTRSSEEQIRQLEKRVKTFLDRNEKATEDFITRIDKEVRAQVASLRGEIEHLQRRLAELVKPPTKAAKKAAAKRTARKATAKKASTKKRTVKKAGVKKRTAKKVTR